MKNRKDDVALSSLTGLMGSRLPFKGIVGILCALACLLTVSSAWAQSQEIGRAQLQIAGTRLVVSPAEQTVPFDTPTIIHTELEGYDPNRGVLPSSMRVQGDLLGPEVNGILTLETVPGEPFRIPRMRVEGEYRIENIRLMLDGDLLAYAEPREALVRVTQILITRVSSRSLTLDEIRSQGLVIDENSFDAINLTFAYGVAGKTFDFNIPLVYDRFGPDLNLVANPDQVRLPDFLTPHRTVKERFKVPKVIPFLVELERPEREEIPSGGCDPKEECRPELKVIKPMVGVILFPTEVSLLHQFFSVVLQVENGAPEGDPATLRDLFTTIKLPPGLRLGETEPPTLLGRPVPIKDPGPDGIRGTADDKNFLVARASGDVEMLLEGVKHGTHIVEFDINGVLDGLPTGPQSVHGSAKGAVSVRDPRLSAHIAHPQVVRSDVEYSVFITLSNIGNTPVNLINLKLPTHALSGIVMVGSNEQQIEKLDPGESETVEFLVESRRTGKVVSSSLRVGSSIDPSFEWSVAVGDDGSLSPDSLVLPTTSSILPKELSRQALALLGIGYSLAQAPPSLGSGMPRVSEEAVAERTYRFGQVGRHLDYGEPVFDVASTLIADWLGVRDGDWEWDQLRRQSKNGAKLAVSLADLLDAESSSPLDAFRRFAATTHYLEPQAVLATGGLQLQVSSRTSGKAVTGAGDAEDRVRDLPFAELYDLTGGDLVVLGQEESGGFSARVHADTATSGDLLLLVRDRTVPDVDGGMREIRFSGISLAAGAQARVAFHSTDNTFALEEDADGDGIYESSRSPFVDTIAPRPFQVLAAVQNTVVDNGGHVVDVLFSEEVDLASMVPRDFDRFLLPDNESNGGLVPTEQDLVMGILTGFETYENPFEGLNNPRVVKVVFDNPVSPFIDNLLTVSDLKNRAGETLATQQTLVETRVDTPAIQVEGVIYGPDGQPLPSATVVLYERDRMGAGTNVRCLEHPTAKVTSDAEGRYHFGFVRNGPCGNRFRIYAQDPTNGHFGNVRDFVKNAGTTKTRDLVMPGRGTVIGGVTYEDGTVPENLRVVVYNPERKAGRLAHVDELGRFDAEHVVVGTLTLSVDDREGHFAYATFELPQRGETVEKNVVIVRNDPQVEPPGQVRGTVKTVDGEPVFDAYVALYIDKDLSSVARSNLDGSFDFGVVPSGIAEIEVFTESSTLPGLGAAAQVFFEIHPDQTETVDILVREDRGTIQGHVYRLALDGTTTPVEGAVVWADDTHYHTVTDAQGAYSLTDVFAGDWYINAAIPAMGESVSEPVTITTAGGVVDRDLYFEPSLPAGGIIGRVLDFDGTPLQGARIHLSGGYYSTVWRYSELTDSDGRFIIEGLGPGTYGVHALSGNNGAIGWANVRFPGDTEQMTVRFEKGTIRGRTVAPVGEDGSIDGVISQIAYRKVEVVTKWDLVVVPPDFTYIETDPNGYFEIEGLIGPYELHVFNAFHGDARARGQLDYHGQVVEHEFEFKPNGDIRGIVYDYDGETPVAGARVSLKGRNFADYDVHTDENGEYHFPLIPPGYYEIHAFHSEGVVYRRARVSATVRRPGQQVNGVEVVLPIQGALTGWVQDADGYPVGGAVVTMQESRYPWRKEVQNADEEGNYAFENVFGGGPVTIYAKAPSLGGLKARTQAEIFFEAQDVLTVLTLEATGELAGTVYMPAEGGGQGDEAVPLASVELSRNGFFEDATTSDSEGKFYFDKLPLGFYQARVFDQGTGRRGRSAWVELKANNDLVFADVELESRGTVRGRFIDGDTGSPLPGHPIQLRTTRWFWSYATTDIDGYFEFGGIPEGDFALRASDTNKRRWVLGSGVIQYEDQEVVIDLELAPLSEITGRVHNPPGATEGLAENVNVHISQSNQIIGAGFDNPFAFDGVIPRRPFKIVAKENGGLRQAKVSSRINRAGQDRDFDLTLQALGSVKVTVTDSFGMPVNGADIHVANRHDFGYEGFDASTGADHEVTFSDIREGPVSVLARNPVNGLRGSDSGNLTLDGQVLNLNVVLQDTGFVRGRAVLADGITPAVGATVALKRGNKWLLGETDELGFFVFETVTMGSYKLIIQEDEGLGLIERFGSLTSNGENDDWGLLRLDEVDPFVVSIEPASGTRDLPLNTQITITFSEPMDASRQGSSVKLRKISGGNVGFASSWSADGTQLTMIPNSALRSGTGYDVFISQAVYDLAGRNLQWRVRSNFFTADVIPPAVIRSLPRSNDVQVSVDTNILVTFSEPVALESLSGTAIQVTDLTAGQGLTTTFQLRPGDREVIITPAVALAVDHDIQVTIQNVADLAGNVMPTPVSWSFWTPDETVPIGSFTAPDAGAVFTAGDEIAVAATATDNRGMGNIRFSIGDWSQTDSSSPFAATLWAPVVAQAGSVDITALLSDRFGNTTTLTRSIQVEPHVNGVAPTVVADCWHDGDWIQAGVQIPLKFRIEDDERIESYALIVDGEVVERFTPVNVASVNKTLNWRPPHDTPPDTTFEIKVQARDYAGNIGEFVANMWVPAGQARTTDQVINELVNGQDLILGKGTFTIDKALEPASIRMMREAKIITRLNGVDFTVTGDMTVQCGAIIDMIGKGYAGDIGGGVGAGPDWVSTATRDTGGSHGGAGQANQTSASSPDVYDSIYRPTLMGGGSPQLAASMAGGGGGIIKLEIGGNLRVDGTLDARGTRGSAGGTLMITAPSLTGGGRLNANGGDGLFSTSHGSGGPGGGGRIALYVDDLTGIDVMAQVTARGGIKPYRIYSSYSSAKIAAPGSIFIHTTGSTYGELVLTNGLDGEGAPRTATVPAELPTLGEGAVTAVSSAAADLWITGDQTFRPRWLGAWMTLLDAGGNELGTFEVVELTDGDARLAGASSAAAASGYRGVYRFDRFRAIHSGFRMNDPLDVDTVELEGRVSYPSDLAINDLILRAGGALVSDTADESFTVEVAGTLTIEDGARIDMVARGYDSGPVGQPAQAPEWVSPSYKDAGGSHGGHGASQRSSGQAGDVYDSVYQPQLSGGGGTAFEDRENYPGGGDGGGIIVVRASEIVLDGQITARGQRGTHGYGHEGGAGAGGTVHLTAGVLRGSGFITAASGDTPWSGLFGESGTGGGGRVALYVDDLSQFDVLSQVSARQGFNINGNGDKAPYSAPGTIYVSTPSSTYGDLYVKAGQMDGVDRGSISTELPVLGTGTVTATEVAASDLWITAGEGPFRPRWHGVWVVLIDAVGQDLAAYRVAELDIAGRALLEGAAAVTDAVAYRGEYRFDEVQVLNGAGLVTGDTVNVTDLVLDGSTELNGSVIAENLTVKSGAVLKPASGERLDFVVSGTLTIEEGAVVDVTGRGYDSGPLGQPAQAPDWVAPSYRDAGGSHGGHGRAQKTSGQHGDVYDSVYHPQLSGGGGTAFEARDNYPGGGDGGGIITIRATEVVLNGTLNARGERGTHGYGHEGGAGAGGTVHLTADVLRGSGSISAAAGDTTWSGLFGESGTGGGGRVALFVDDLTAFDVASQVSARQGYNTNGNGDRAPYSAPGTIYVSSSDSTYGDLLLMAGELNGTDLGSIPTELPYLGTGTVTAIEAVDGDLWVTSSEVFRARWHGAWMALDDGTNTELGVFRVLELDSLGRARLEGAALIAGAASYRGEYRFDNVQLLNGAGLSALDPVVGPAVVFEGSTEVSGTVSATDVIVKAGATVKPASGERLDFVVSGTLTIEEGAVVDVTGRGYDSGPLGQPAQAPDWVAPSYRDAGGSHGGHGRAQKTSGQHGDVYDSVYHPQLSGGGGTAFEARDNYPGGGDGGGIITIRATEVVLNGTLNARGERGTHGYGHEGGAGAGGTVHLTADVLRGSGSISAAAGDTTWSGLFGESGTGGGGRVALFVDDLTAFDVASQVSARQGYNTNGNGDKAPYSAPGTIYVSSSDSTYGDLLLMAGELNGADLGSIPTELPYLGTGTVTAIEAVDGDLWVTSSEVFRARWHGAWMALDDGTNTELGVFRVLELDSAGRARLEGAALIAGAASYRGEYRFDNVQLLNGAGLSALDPVVGPEVVFEGSTEVGGTVSATHVVVKAGATVRPVSGERLDFVVSGTMTVEAGAVIDVTGRGYDSGPKNQPAQAPDWVTPAHKDAGGSHGGHGTIQRTSGQRGDVYDSVYHPQLSGGGGTAYEDRDGVPGGGDGGGIITIRAAELVLDGTLKAQGERGTKGYGHEGGAGAGGTVHITAGAMRGSGSINAAAGDTPWSGLFGESGNGGGGRVALWVGDLSEFDVASQITARHGQNTNGNGDKSPYAAPGTIYVSSSSSTYGDLYLKGASASNGNDYGVIATELPLLGTGTVTATEVLGNDLWVTGGELFRPRWHGVWMTLDDGAGTELGVYRVLELDNIGRALLEDASSVTGAAGYRGEYRFDKVTFLHGADVKALDKVTGGHVTVDGNTTIEGDLTPSSITVEEGAKLKPLNVGVVHWQLDSLTVKTGGELSVVGLGYAGGANGEPAGTPDGVETATGYAGGSHGGLGGKGTHDPGTAGEVYDSVYTPMLPGAGGGENEGRGLAGGGVLWIEANTVHLDGKLNARGEYIPGLRGPGAGGTIRIHAPVMTGTGIIDVSGRGARGSGCCSWYAFAGGGRAALYVDDLSGYELSGVRTIGSDLGQTVPRGAPGTLFVFDSESVYGDLMIDGENTATVPKTRLPSIGRGFIGTLTPESSDAWIEPLDANARFSVGVAGMWLRVNNTDYKVLAERADRRGLLIEGGAGALQVGDKYVGVYKFDSVTVDGGARLLFDDADEVGVWTTGGVSSIERLDVFPPTVSIDAPAAGSLYAAGEVITVQATVVDADSALGAVTLRLADQVLVDDTAPYEWAVTAPSVTESESLTLEVEAFDIWQNRATASVPVTIQSVPSGDPPVVTLLCPSAGALIGPGASLQVGADATDDHEVLKVEFLLSGEVQAVDYDAPYGGLVTAPVDAADGSILSLEVRAYDLAGQTGSATIDVSVVVGTLITADTVVSAGDVSLDGTSVVVSGASVTFDGMHSLRDLVLLNGATARHSATAPGSVGSLQLELIRDLYIACDSAIDVSGLGHAGSTPRGESMAGTDEGANVDTGGSHGGRGGGFDGSGRIVGSPFNPREAGGGGGGSNATAGGGVIRLAVLGNAVVDGMISAKGGGDGTSYNHGAGGSIRLDVGDLRGQGTIDASGAGSNTTKAGGGGGRVALYAGTMDQGLLDRVRVTGGSATQAAKAGAAGTLFVRLDGQAFGDLIVDNHEVVSTQLTELPSVGVGTVTAVDLGDDGQGGSMAIGVTDDQADFTSSLEGLELVLNDDLSTLWQIDDHAHHVQSLTLGVSGQPLTAQVGDAYSGVLRLDSLTLAGQVHLFTRDRVLSTSTPSVDGSSTLQEAYLPSVTLTEPIAGAVFIAGDSIGVTGTVDDPLGFDEVTLRFGDHAEVDDASPFTHTWVAPTVTVPTPYEVSIETTDHAGRVLRDAATVTVEPLPDLFAPEVVLGSCPVDQDFAVAGTPVDVGFVATDNDAVARYQLLVDGVVTRDVSDLNAPEISATVSWTVPADATAGAIYTLELRAFDFSGGYGSAQLQLRVPSGNVLVGTQTVDPALWDGQDLLLGNGTFTIPSDFSPTSLTLSQGATITRASEAPMVLNVAQSMVVQCGAAIGLTSRGYAGGTNSHYNGYGPGGVTPARHYAGGSHGGVGRAGYTSGNQGEVYDSVYLPSELGSGGARGDTSQNGGRGGGMLMLNAQTVRLDGEIQVAGLSRSNSYAGTGAGGTVVIFADTLIGSGSIDASGGDDFRTNSRHAGLGGGGRVALYVDDLTTFDAKNQVRVRGGSRHEINGAVNVDAAPGTIFVKHAASTHGDLIINGGSDVRTMPLTSLPTLGSGAVASTEAADADLWITAGSAFRVRWLGVYITLQDAAGLELGRFEVLDVDAGGRLLLKGAVAHEAVAVTYAGEYRFDHLSLLGGARLDTLDAIHGSEIDFTDDTEVPTSLSADSMTVRSGVVVGLLNHYSQLDLQVSGTLTLETDAVISVYADGYDGGTNGDYLGHAPAGIGRAKKYGGGSHGATGRVGYGGGQAGELHDSVYVPRFPGGGGGRGDTSQNGGAGGGVIKIQAGAIVLDGTLAANGQTRTNSYAGTGAGGTVAIEAGSLTGSGEILATGGRETRTSSRYGGLGSGGRVALHVDSITGFDPVSQISVVGGPRFETSGANNINAAPGTVYVRQGQSTFGDLIINGHSDTLTMPITELPALGTGSITAMELAGDDLWISAAAAFQIRWHGAYVRLFDAAGVELGLFRAGDLDDTGRLLLLGAGTAQVSADHFVGEYHFDKTVLLGGARLDATDTMHGGHLDLAADTEIPNLLIADQLTIRSGVLVGLLNHYQQLDLRVAGTLTIESGAGLTAYADGHDGGTNGDYLGHGPVGIGRAARYGGGSHGATGRFGYGGGKAGEVNDSVYWPRFAGSGGGRGDTSQNGGAGGGVIKIQAGSMVLDGTVAANGQDRTNSYAGTGAGGTVLIEADSLSGSGEVLARGGKEIRINSRYSGLGSGGRIAFYVDDLTGFDPVAQASVVGGWRIETSGAINVDAAVGTVFVKHSTSTFGDLIINGHVTTREITSTDLPPLGTGAISLAEVEGDDLWITGAAAFQARWHGAYVRLSDSLGVDLGRFEVLEIDATGRIRVAAAGTHQATAVNYAGEYAFDSVTLTGGARLDAADPVDGGIFDFGATTRIPNRLIADQVTVRSGAVVSLKDSYSKLDFRISGTLTVEAGAELTASYDGHDGGDNADLKGHSPVGIGRAARYGGGSHGGAGRAGYGGGAPGEIHDSVYLPGQAGSGGGRGDTSQNGGTGGGMLRLSAGSVVLDGILSANGATRTSSYAGTGAGGTVLIEATSLSGTGIIEAYGGDEIRINSRYCGLGGGGRVALWVDDVSGFDLNRVLVQGGKRIETNGQLKRNAAAGTLYVTDSTATYGDLIVDAHFEGQEPDTQIVTTKLPPLLSGLITATESLDGGASSDVWITGEAALPMRWLGAWVTLEDGSGDIGTYPVIEIDELGRLRLLEAGSAALTATGYRGDYHFDSVTAQGGAVLDTSNISSGVTPPALTLGSPNHE